MAQRPLSCVQYPVLYLSRLQRICVFPMIFEIAIRCSPGDFGFCFCPANELPRPPPLLGERGGQHAPSVRHHLMIVGLTLVMTPPCGAAHQHTHTCVCVCVGLQEHATKGSRSGLSVSVGCISPEPVVRRVVYSDESRQRTGKQRGGGAFVCCFFVCVLLFFVCVTSFVFVLVVP